jgi:transposase
MGQKWHIRKNIDSHKKGQINRRNIENGFPGLNREKSPPRWHGSVKKNGPQAIGKTRGGWTTKIHMVCQTNREPVACSLSAGNKDDASEGRLLLDSIGKIREIGSIPLMMDRAYEDWKTRFLAWELHFNPVVPPKKNRKEPWEYDNELYKHRNEIERLFRRLESFRRVFTRYDKLDVIYLAFVHLALCCILSLV